MIHLALYVVDDDDDDVYNVCICQQHWLYFSEVDMPVILIDDNSDDNNNQQSNRQPAFLIDDCYG